MAKPTNNSLFLQNRLVLTREISGEDIPIWSGKFSREFTKRDDLYCLGSNLLIWYYNDKKKTYYPAIVDPSDPTNDVLHYKEVEVASPNSVLFIPGRRMDLLIDPFFVEKPLQLVNNQVAGFVVHFIRNGAIIKNETIALKDIQLNHRFSKENVRLYQDKFIVFVNGKTLYMINILTGTQVKMFEDVPADGVLILDRNNAIIWSRIDSRKAVVNLEDGTKNTIGLAQIDPDMNILGFSVQNLLVGNSERIVFYNEWGAVILKRNIDKKARTIFDGILDSFSSLNLAFVLRENEAGTVFTCKDGYLLEHEIGKIATRSLLLYEDLVYATSSRVSLDMWVVTNLDPEFIDRTIADHPINRYMRVSPSFGWILELQNTPLDDGKFIHIRAPADRPITLPIPIKKQWPEYTPDHCVLPPFIYTNQLGQVRIWTGEEYKTTLGTKAVHLTLYEWDLLTETMGQKLKEIDSIPVPENPTFGRWFKTEQWVVLAVGRKAYIFEHEGSRVAQMIELESKYDFNIKSVKGFGHSLWFLGGQTQQALDDSTNTKITVEKIKEVWFWDGIDAVSRVDLDVGIDMKGACATGVRNQKSGLELLRAELVISSSDVRSSWYKLCYMRDGKGITYDDHFGIKDVGALAYRDNLLCETADKEGRVFFAEGRSISVYLPWRKAIYQKADLDYIHVNQKDPFINAIVTNDKVFSLAIGKRYLWVGCGSTFYCLALATLNDTDVKEYNQPIKAVRYYDERRPRAEFQPPTVMRPYLSNLEDLDDEAIFENEEFIWLSNSPYELYRRPEMMSVKNLLFVVVNDRSKMLVLSSYFGKSADGTKVTIRSALCEVLL